MPHPLPDAQARARALDPEESFIVQAPAGSGKTGLLTQRFLKLLAGVEHPEEIVAITFTRKAAAEMGERVLAALARAGEPEAEADTPHGRLTRELARAALARDEARGWQLTRHPGRLRILTFDALCAAIARQAPLLSGFGALPGVVEGGVAAARLYRDAARAALAEVESGRRWSPAVARLLAHLDNDSRRVTELLAAMLPRRDQWLRHTLDDARKNRPLLEAALARVGEEALRRVVELTPDHVLDTLPEWAAFAAGNLDEGHLLAPWRREEVFLSGEPESLPLWRGVVFLLLTDKGEWRKPGGINVKVGFPALKDARSVEMKKGLQELLARLGEEGEEGDEALRMALHRLRQLPPDQYSEEQWSLVAALQELLPMTAGQLRLLFAERGEVDFAEVAFRASTALGEPEQPSDLALRLDYRLRHLLVDEFQDTSVSQHQLLERLITGWSPGDGRTLFLVGDPMQSIYRFREAEVGLFLRVRERGIGDLQPLALRLMVNFRSQAGIVDWVNAVFAQVLPAQGDPALGAVPYAESHAFHPALPGPAVVCHGFAPGDRQGEGERVAELAATTLAADDHATVAILVRARPHLAAILPALDRRGLRYQATEIASLGERPVIRDLLALTRALLRPHDRVAWLAVLRAPWCGLTLEDLLLLVGEDRDHGVWELLAARGQLLSLDGQARVGRIQPVLAAALRQAGRVPLRPWVEGTWRALMGPQCVAAAQDLEDADAFLALLAAVDDRGEAVDLELLTGQAQALYARPDALADGRLQVMTIHKAKGLEFDTVILPGLGARARGLEQRLLLWQERADWPGATGLLLGPVQAVGGESDPIHAYLREVEKEKQHHETGRLLYVAATRAARRLHLLGEVIPGEEPRPPAPSLLHELWPAVAMAFQESMASLPEGEGRDVVSPPPPLRRLSLTWQAPPGTARFPFLEETPVTGEQAVEYQWAGERVRVVGVVVHGLLRLIAREGGAAWPPARLATLKPITTAWLRQEGMAGETLLAAARDVASALSRALADERGRWVLDARHQEAASELALTGMVDGQRQRVVVDRTFVDEAGQRWIIDYKTSVHAGGNLEGFLDNEQQRYHPQLERYARLFAQWEGRPIALGLYFPMLPGWRAWTWSNS